MNRLLYQLSYAAMGGQQIPASPKSALLLYTALSYLSRRIFVFFLNFLAMLSCGVIVMKFGKQIILFILGGLGYMGLECLWRGWSHGSMFLAGGSCFLLLGKLENTKPRLIWPFRALMGMLVVTAVELLAGLLFNRSYAVWDYRNMPCNFYGQICLPFALLWFPVSMCAMWLYKALDRCFLKWHSGLTGAGCPMWKTQRK
jgi:hypothetical protein